MHSSTRRSLAAQRSRYTDEPHAAARAGVGRSGNLGLDTCTDAQRRFRALLTLHLFNEATGVLPYATSGAAKFLAYTVSMSARRDHLAVIMDSAVNNVVGRLLTDEERQDGVAGLRVTAAHEGHTFHLVHLPTAARMIIADRPVFESASSISERARRWSHRWPDASLGLSDREQQAIHLARALSPDVERLLAGLLVRVGAKDVAGRWNLRHWTCGASHLWGYGDQWELEWLRNSHADDVAAALTDPVFGIASADAATSSDGRHVDVMLGAGRLRLLRS